MWPVSDEFLQAIRYSHQKITRLDLYQGAQPLETSLPLLTATVQDDFTADVRRRCDVTLPGTEEVLDLLPEHPDDDGGLWPIGNEIRIRSGIVYSDGSEELVPMGVFRISNPIIRIDSQGERVVSIKGYDRSRAVSRNKFIEPYITSRFGVDMAQEIKALIQSRMPLLTDEDFVIMTSFHRPSQRNFLRDNDPWKDAAVEMAKSIGAQVYFDGLGRLVVEEAPDPLADPVTFDYIAGEDATLLDADRTLDDENAYNGVVASSQSTENDKIFEAQVWDTDLHSPTYFDPDYPERSFYGAFPFFYTSEFITNLTQAKDAARGQFNQLAGIVETYDFSAICNPAHVSGDTIKVEEPLTHINDVNLVNVINFNLTGNTMTMQTRRRARGGAVE